MQVATAETSSSGVMGSLLQCIRNCLEDDEPNEQEEQHARDHEFDAPQSNRVERADDDGVVTDRCCQPTRSGGPHNNPFHWIQFWHKMSKVNYQHLATSDGDSSPLTLDEEQRRLAARSFGALRRSSSTNRRNTDCNKSPLRTACSFDSSRDILTIRMEEIVLPGSALQQQMACKMNESMQIPDIENECVICMDGFSNDNPRMPTLCGCGENRTYFHLPCLYQWMEQSDECPSCRQKITWEEF